MKYFSFVILILLILGCQDVKKPEKPQNLIPKESMVNILTDAYISNAARSINNKRLKEYQVSLDSIIYKKYGIDSLQFIESNAYYSSNLKTYTKILVSVEERLEILQKEKDSIYEIVKKEKGDTITISKNNNAKGILFEPVKD